MNKQNYYTPTTVLIEPNQERRIITALRKGKGCYIKTRKLYNADEDSPMSTARDFSEKSASKGVLLLNPAQFKKYHKSIPGTVVSLPFQREHLEANLRHKGGFLPILAALLLSLIHI